MSKRKPKLLFGNWTMWDLNPSNYSIKNDWVENLIHIGSITSGLACQVPNAKIVKAYEPNTYGYVSDKCMRPSDIGHIEIYLTPRITNLAINNYKQKAKIDMDILV